MWHTNKGIGLMACNVYVFIFLNYPAPATQPRSYSITPRKPLGERRSITQDVSENLVNYPRVENPLPKNGVFSEVDFSQPVA